MRTTTHRYVYRPTGQCELYDMQADPQELHNLCGDPAQRALAQEMEAKILHWLVQTSDVTPFDANPRGHRGSAY